MPEDSEDIGLAIKRVQNYRASSFLFGTGNSAERFMEIIKDKEFWTMKIQKQFVDRDM